MCKPHHKPKAQETCVVRRCPKNDRLQWFTTPWGEVVTHGDRQTDAHAVQTHPHILCITLYTPTHKETQTCIEDCLDRNAFATNIHIQSADAVSPRQNKANSLNTKGKHFRHSLYKLNTVAMAMRGDLALFSPLGDQLFSLRVLTLSYSLRSLFANGASSGHSLRSAPHPVVQVSEGESCVVGRGIHRGATQSSL